MQTVERLENAGLLDDEKYASDFIETRLNTKPVSKFRLREQLKGHFVPDDIIDDALINVADDTELENACQLVRKFTRQFSDQCSGEELERRIYSRLSSRGFSHETIQQAMKEAEE